MTLKSQFPTLISKIFQRKIKPEAEAEVQQPIPNEALYAFRTITTMLSLIRSRKQIPAKKEKKNSSLKVLDALSAVIIREHGVAAVVANPHDGSGTIQVLVSVTCPNHKNPVEPSISEAAPPIVVVVPKPITQDLEAFDVPAQLLDNFLQHVWHKPDEDTFGTHIWMLNKLIERSGEDMRSLRHYVVASCYKKLIMRMDHHISRKYLTALENLPNFEFSEESDKPKPKGDKMECDHLFLSLLPKLKPHLGIEIPNLMQQVGHDDVYTRETCHEFHLILCRLLTVFFDSLKALDKLRDSEEGHTDTTRIHDQLDLIKEVGTTLMLMNRSTAMKKHARLIAKFLPVFVKQTEFNADAEFHGIQPDTPAKAFSNWLKLMVNHFEAIQHVARFIKSVPGSKVIIQTLSQSPDSPPDRNMLPWLTLLKNKDYFPDNGRVRDIIEFLSHPRYAEHDGEDDGEDVDGADTGEDTGEDLGRLSAEELVWWLKKINNVPKFVRTPDGPKPNPDAFTLEPIINSVKRHGLTNCTSPASDSHTKTIVRKLETLRDMWQYTNPHDAVRDINKLVEMTYTIRDNARLYWALRDDAPLSTGIGFSGNHHAEATLAAFCSLSKQELDFVPALGVSEWCCPVCAHLLGHWSSGLGRNGKPLLFVFTNSHSTFSPCSLPHGLPKDVIDRLIKTFGDQLRQELIDLERRTEILQPCDTSLCSGYERGGGSVVDLLTGPNLDVYKDLDLKDCWVGS